jgi:serine/threonine protein kinase
VSASESRTVERTFGSCQLIERVGAGALGDVYRARDTIHGRTVALKRVPAAVTDDPERRAALDDAAAAAARVSHPAVAVLYELGVDGGETFLAHEFVPGQTLAAMLSGRPLHPRRATEIAIEIADGLAAIHAAGLVHGDLRPDNVIVTPKGHAKLLDAGFAAFTAGGALRTSAGQRLGALPAAAVPTLRYLAPEEALGEGGDARSDLFALGAILYEMLTGQPTFPQQDPDDLLLAIVQSTPSSPRSRSTTVTPELDRVVMRALGKSLDSRYQTAETLAADLRSIRAGLERTAAAASGDEEEQQQQRPWLRIILVILALLAAAILLAWIGSG